jgi:hypothetical protein
MAGHKTSYSVTGSITALTSNQWTCPRHKSSRLYMSPRTAPQKPTSHGSAQTSRLKGDASGSTQKCRPVPHHEHPPETLPPKISPDPPIVCAPKTPPTGSRARSGMRNPPETPPMEHCEKRYSLIAAAAFTPQKPRLAPIPRPKRYPDSLLLEAPQSSAREDPRRFHNRHPRLNWRPLAGLCHPY